MMLRRIIQIDKEKCNGSSAKPALQYGGKRIPWQVVTVSTDGRQID